MSKKSPYPKCIYCKKRKATRWDGGQLGVVYKNGRKEPGYIVWCCTKCDPRHKCYDLPSKIEDAIAEIVFLRELLQAEFWTVFGTSEELHRYKLRYDIGPNEGD
jgi:hypothetical protein